MKKTKKRVRRRAGPFGAGRGKNLNEAKLPDFKKPEKQKGADFIRPDPASHD